MRIFHVYCPYVFIDLLDLFLTTEDTESTEEDKKILKCTALKRSVSYPLCEYYLFYTALRYLRLNI